MKPYEEGQEMWSVYVRRSLITVTMLALVGCGEKRADDEVVRVEPEPAVVQETTTAITTERKVRVEPPTIIEEHPKASVEIPPTPPATATETTTTAVTPVPTTARGNNLELTAPIRPITTNPFEVRGRARTFENHVTIRVLDENKKILVETHATATGDLGQLNPFHRSIILTRPPGKEVTVELLDHSAKDGSLRERVAQTVAYEVPDTSMKLYFSAPGSGTDCTRVVAAERPAPKSKSMIRATVEALMAGPSMAEMKRGLSAPFPRGASIRGVNLRDGVAIVDFDESMRNVGGACRAQALRAMIEKSLGDIAGVKSVEIRAGGSRELALQP
jgi:hypothetical protein